MSDQPETTEWAKKHKPNLGPYSEEHPRRCLDCGHPLEDGSSWFDEKCQLDTTPRRVKRQRTKGWRMPPNTVYVGRPTRWGNPFLTAEHFEAALSQFPVSSVTLDLWRQAGGRVDMLIAIAGRVSSVLAELRGKNLACWCPLDRRCHADTLLEIANA